MGTLNVGEWVEGGETVTYDPCPPRPVHTAGAP